MPRSARTKSESGVYHVMQRGIDKCYIFEEPADYIRFLVCLEEVKAISHFTLYAYCLMPNHFHLLLREGEEPLSKVFVRLSSRYVGWFNRKYDRCGHLFQDRYRSKPVETTASFLRVLSYIHQNPVKANLCVLPSDYPWGSRRSLGMGTNVVDEAKLFEMYSLDRIVRLERELDSVATLDCDDNQSHFMKDAEAITLLRELSHTTCTSSFLALSRPRQSQVVRLLRERRASCRQIARITGLSKGVVDRMCQRDSPPGSAI
jgi:REP element-mobilizing transposase RayT